jgi:hypothetical protein
MNRYGNFVSRDTGPSETEFSYAERLTRWEAERRAASDALQESQRKQDRLYQELIDE